MMLIDTSIEWLDRPVESPVSPSPNEPDELDAFLYYCSIQPRLGPW